MTSQPQPSRKGKEKRDPPANHEEDEYGEYEQEEQQPIPRPRDDRILSFIPNDGIDYNVIRTEIQPFLGPEASVARGKHPTTKRPGYFIRAYKSISISMISDLKMDTIRWNDEMRLSNNRDYKLSNTHRSRQKSGPTPEALASPTIPSPSQHHTEEPRSALLDTRSQQAEISYRDTHPGRADGGQQPQTQRGYEEPTRSSDPFSRSDPQRHAPQGQESHSAYTQTATAIYIQNIQPPSTTTTVPSSAAPPTFTRQDVEKKVLQRLKDQGHTGITRSEFEKAVDSAMRSLEAEALAREDRATSVPPPYSEHAGGQSLPRPSQSNTSSTRSFSSEHAGGQSLPRPSQPNTTGTRGFSAAYATAGPDDSRPPGPDYSRHRK